MICINSKNWHKTNHFEHKYAQFDIYCIHFVRDSTNGDRPQLQVENLR